MGLVRFLLALWVVAAHSKGNALLGVTPFNSGTAVQCFYVVSGFLITMVLNERAEYGRVFNFYASRYLRLWPSYIVIALLAACVSWVLGPRLIPPPDTSITAWAVLALANLTLFAQDWIMFLKFDGGGLAFTGHFGLLAPPQPYSFVLVPQAWTLGIELTFYLIAPFVCRRWWTVALLFLFGLGVRLVLGWLDLTFGAWLYRFAPAEMMLFAAGGLAYFAGRPLRRYKLATNIAGLVGIAGFVALTLAAGYITPLLSHYFGAINSTLALAYWPVLVFAVLLAAPLFYATRNNRLDQILGELSYPMYVCHILAGATLVRWTGNRWPDDGNLSYLALVIVLSLGLIYAVIKPVDRHLRNRFGARFDPPKSSYRASYSTPR